MTFPSQTPLTNPELFPSTERIFGWIEFLAGLGHRKTGTPQGRASAEYIAGELRSFGLNPVIESVPTPCPVVHAAQLVLNQEFNCFWVNGTGRQAELGRFSSDLNEVEFVYLGHGWDEDFENVDVSGKVVVCDIEFKPWKNSDILERNPRGESFDPEDTLSVEYNKYDIYSPHNWPFNYFTAQKNGAVGFVGSLLNYMDEVNYNEDYTENGEALGVDRMEIPAVWISKQDGTSLAATLNNESLTSAGKFRLDVEYELKDALNINAILTGQSSELILIHSHHDAVFNGAVQDASGVSEVLAQAEYFSKLPLTLRPKSFMFALTDTHFTDYVGHLGFLAEREKAQDNIILDLCIEHIAKEIELDADNRPIETGHVEPRLVYITEESGLYQDVREAFERNNLSRTFFLPVHIQEQKADVPYVFNSEEVISDAYYFAEAGMPVVSLVCGPMYLFHPSDTLDRIAVDQLRPVGLAFAEIATIASQKAK